MHMMDLAIGIMKNDEAIEGENRSQSPFKTKDFNTYCTQEYVQMSGKHEEDTRHHEPVEK